MSTTDDQLSAISAQLQTFLATLDNSVNWQVLFLAGSTDDPDSFDANGGKTGALGYYPIVNVSGQTVYMPCLARMKAIALGGANAETLDALLGTANTKLAAVDLAVDQTNAARDQAAENATYAAAQGDYAKQQGAAIGDITVAVAVTSEAKQVATAAAAAAAAVASTAVDTELVGSITTPVAGSAAVSNGTYWFASPLANPSTSVRVKGFNSSGAPGTIKLKIGTLQGGTITATNSLSAAVPTGAYDVTFTTTAAAGQYLGIWTGGASAGSAGSCVTYTGGAGGAATPYWVAAGDTGTVNAAGAAIAINRVEIQILSTYSYVTTARVKAVSTAAAVAKSSADNSAAALTATAVIGRPAGAAVSGPVLSSGSYFFATGAPGNGTIKRVHGFNPQSTAKTIYLRQASAAGAILAGNIAVTVPSGAFNLDLMTDVGLSAYPTIAKGVFPGFHPGAASFSAGPTDNGICYVGTAGDNGGYYNNGQASSASTVGFTPGAPTMSNQLQIGFDIDYTAVTAARIASVEASVEILKGTASSTTPVGGWYAAGDSTTWGAELSSPATQRWNALLATMLGKAITSWGTSGARTDEIVMRAGGLNATVSVSGGSIPASGAVNLTGMSIQPLRGAGSASADQLSLDIDLRLYDGSKVRGTITRQTPNSDTDVVFTRSVAGSATPASGIVDVLPFTPQAAWNGVMLLGAGRNDLGLISGGSRSLNDIYSWYRSAAEVMRSRGGVLLPWGTFDAGTGEAPGTATGNLIAQLETFLTGQFGIYFIPVRKYLASARALADAAIVQSGFAPTSGDTAAVAAGVVPPSFQSTLTTPDVHLNALGHQLQARFMYRWITAPQLAGKLGLAS